jgi:hypothetical protein
MNPMEVAQAEGNVSTDIDSGVVPKACPGKAALSLTLVDGQFLFGGWTIPVCET